MLIVSKPPWYMTIDFRMSYRGWACCAWIPRRATIVFARFTHALVAYEILIQHDDVVFINSATNCLSLCVYYEHLFSLF